MASEPAWRPDPATAAASNMARFLARCSARYESAPRPDAPYRRWHAWSCEHAGEFWPAVWDDAALISDVGSDGTRWRHAVEQAGAMRPPREPGGPRWFTGARLNFAENLLRHRGSEPAIIAHGEGAPRLIVSRDDLIVQVAAFASALRSIGIAPGDRVAGFIPNVPEAVIAMLGAASIGAVWSSCSPDFGAQGVLDRFGQIAPRVLVAGGGYCYAGKQIDCLPRVRDIVEAIPSIAHVVVVPPATSVAGDPATLPDVGAIRGSLTWSAFLALASRTEPRYERLPFDHPLYIMYSSGTTGLPKCMVHGAGGTLLQLVKEHLLHVDLKPLDRVFYFTTCGWMMWNWLVNALATGATIVLYDGAPMPPGDPAALWRMAGAEALTVFGTSAKFIALSEKAGIRPAREADLTSLRTVLSTGSPLAPEGFDYVAREVGSRVQLSSISGGTDIISAFALGHPQLPVWRGELQCAGLGMAIDVFDDAGNSIDGRPGELVCTRPFPSMPVAFWNDADGAKYRAAYFSRFPEVWRHGDWAEHTSHGGFIIHGRSDATLNPGGVRIGTAEIYRQVELLDEVVESVAVGQQLSTSGGDDVRIVLFVRLRDDIALDGALAERIRARIREGASPHHVPKVVLQVSDIPRTISGKISELAVRDVVHGRTVPNADALANPESLALFRDRPELRL